MVHSVSIVLSSACGPASPMLRSCSTCPCCFRAAPLQCIRTVVTDTRSMAFAGELMRRAPSQRIRTDRMEIDTVDTWRIPDSSTRRTPDTTRGVQRTAARTAYVTQRAAMARSVGAPPHPHGAHGVSAGSRSARGSRRSQRKRTSTHSTRHPAVAHSVCARARVRPSRWRLARHVRGLSRSHCFGVRLAARRRL
jgi:hypothetical protein